MQHYQASELKEHRRLAINFYMLKMEMGEHTEVPASLGSNGEGTRLSGQAR